MSLRLRILLAVGAVVVAAVVGVGWMARRAASHEFHRFLSREQMAPDGALDGAAEALAGRLAGPLAESGWAGIGGELARWSAEQPDGTAAVVLSEDGDVLAASDRQVAAYRFRIEPGGELLLTREPRPGAEETLVLRVPAIRLPAPAGGSAGSLYALVLPERHAAAEPEPEAVFLGSIDRWLLPTVALAGLFALLLTALSTRRILAPIGELTRAARELERGALGRRVEHGGNDEVGRLAGAFNAMAAALERHEALRRNMVSDTAHELRTPLTNLRCQIESVGDGVVAPSADLVASLLEEVVHLQRLVEDLQELALADAGQLRIEAAPLDLAEEISRCRRAMTAARPGAEIEVEPFSTPAVAADPGRLQQILTNLLDNALDHTPAGGRVVLRAARDGDAVTVRVADSGPGLPADQLEAVFERFHRTDPSRQRATGGAGLGLAIVRRLVEAQGGRAWAESAPGEGATFAFTLPIARPEER